MSSAGQWAATIASLVPFGSFAWAIPRHFECRGPMPRGMRVLSLFSLAAYASFIGLVMLRHPHADTPLIGPGLICFVAATLLFWWAIRTTTTKRLSIAYKKVDPDLIVAAGPYAWIRHPFYTSYILFWVGTGFIAGGWQWALALVLMVWYLRIARDEERYFERSGLSAGYAAYRRRTGMLIPVPPLLRRQQH